MEKMNAVNLEKMYEVLKFVEYGGYCRRSMDCVHGMLLIDRMKNEAVVDKAVLFGWFRKMAVCAEQYERCGEVKRGDCIEAGTVKKEIRFIRKEDRL